MDPHRLTKHHGLGNDFLIALNPERPVGREQAILWCDRRTGVGADGLIVGTQADDQWQMILWNSDGSRAEISGNGIRCLGQAITLAAPSQDLLHPSEELAIHTDAGLRTLNVLSNYPAVNTMMLRVGMGKAVDGPAPSDDWDAVGVVPLAQAGVDIGNPHIVAIVESLEGADISTIGPAVEAGYSGGTNVHLVEVRSRSALRILIWERGAGVTEACGSGACASVWAANRLGLTESRVAVSMPGGEVTVDLTDDEIFLTGPATLVAEVTING